MWEVVIIIVRGEEFFLNGDERIYERRLLFGGRDGGTGGL